MSAAWDGVTRCDRCDNGVIAEWVFCPYCGHPQTEEGVAEVDRLTKLQRLATPGQGEVRGRVRWTGYNHLSCSYDAYVGAFYVGSIEQAMGEWSVSIAAVLEYEPVHPIEAAARAALEAAVREAINADPL